MTSTLETLNALTKARELLAEEGAWNEGNLLYERSDGTKCMCALGAVGVATGHADEMMFGNYNVFSEPGPASDAVDVLVKQIEEFGPTWLNLRRRLAELELFRPYKLVYKFNDYHDDVEPILEVFDAAIQRVRDQLALETLIEAKRLIIEKGWGKTELIDYKGCMCALGGIASATTGITTREELLDRFGYSYSQFRQGNECTDEAAVAAVDALRSVLDIDYPSGDFRDIYRFNDTQYSADSVLALFDRAIANLTMEN